MLAISMPYKMVEYKDSVEVHIPALKISCEADSALLAFDKCRTSLEKVIKKKLPKSSVEFLDSGLFTCTNWPDILDLALEYEPIIEVSGTDVDRKERIQSQDHMNSVK